MKNSSVEIILCSPKSVVRPWINFEAGAAWIRDIPVIPLCHSGMKPSALPVPLNLLQAASASEISSLKLIFPVLAGAIGSQVPKVDFSEFVEKVKKFENHYTFWNEVNKYFNDLNSWNSQVINCLKEHQVVSCQLKKTEINLWNSWVPFFRSKNILDFRQIGGTLMDGSGTFYNCEIIRLAEFMRVVNDKNFKL